MSVARFCAALALLAATLAATVLVAPTAPTSAQETTVTCPAGTTPSADGTACLSEAVDDNVVSTTTCTQGVLSADGQFCIVPRLDAAPATPASAPVTAPVPIFTG